VVEDLMKKKNRKQMAHQTKQGKKLFFVSNNSTSSRAQYVHKFEKFGIKVSKVCEETEKEKRK
jgi:ribonucleotide monophosphatase NagD (HAD superfamily)